MSAMLNIAIAAEFELAEKMAACLEQSQLEIEQLSIVEIYPFNEEQGIRFRKKSVVQLAVEDVDWSVFNYVLFAGNVEQATYLAQAAEQGCIVIDVQGLCAGLSDVPVVMPSFNDEDLAGLRQSNIVALPDPQVSQLALLLAGFKQQNLQRVFVTSLLPASYVGGETISQLVGQTAQLLNGVPLDENQPRLAFDVFPAVKTNLAAQLQKLFPQIEQIQFHQIRVPVFYGLAQQVSLFADYALDIAQAKDYWQQNPFIDVQVGQYATPVTNGEQEGNEEEPQLHITQLNELDAGVEFWAVADEQRFNLTLMAVKLTEIIYSQGY